MYPRQGNSAICKSKALEHFMNCIMIPLMKVWVCPRIFTKKTQLNLLLKELI